jgi:hypothetical protein
VADIEPGCVQQHVNAPVPVPDVSHDPPDSVGIGEVHRVVVRLAAGRAYGLDGGECRLQPLVAGELTLDQDGGRAPAASLEPIADRGLKAAAVGREPGQVLVGGIGLGRHIEQVEGAATGLGQIGDDG